MSEDKTAAFFQNAFTSSKRIIHTPSVFAKSALLYLQEAGELSAMRPHISARSQLSSYLFFTVTAGKGRLEYLGQQYELAAGDSVFIDCHAGYAQSTSEHRNADGEFDELWSLSWIHFDGAMMEAIYSKYKERGGKTVFRCENQKRYQNLVQEVFSIAASESYVRDMKIAEKLTGLLAYLMEDAWSSEKAEIHLAPKRQSTKEIKEYIDIHYTDKLTLGFLANKFFMNKEYLAHVFKEEYGFTVNGYISHVRVTKAKNLLRFSGETIEQISAEVGIDDPNYFSRTFKRVEGVSPSRYRKSW